MTRVSTTLRKLKVDEDEAFGVQAVAEALSAPLRQIAENAGAHGSVAANRVENDKGAFGYNALTDSYEDMMEAGVIDPAKVTQSALIHGASVAAMLLSTNALITDIPEKETAPAEAGMDPMGGMGGMGGMPGMGGMGGMGGMPGMGM